MGDNKIQTTKILSYSYLIIYSPCKEERDHGPTVGWAASEELEEMWHVFP